MRNAVKDSVPETRKIFETMSKEITLRDLADELLAKKAGAAPVNVLDIFFAAGGLGVGGPVGGVLGFGARRGLTSPLGLTAGAQVSRGLGIAGQKIGQQIGRAEPVTRTLVPQAIGAISSR